MNPMNQKNDTSNNKSIDEARKKAVNNFSRISLNAT
jgi:hypothetical protein